MTSGFFSRLAESHDIRRGLSRPSGFMCIAGAAGVGATALLLREASHWDSAMVLISADQHDYDLHRLFLCIEKGLNLPGNVSVHPEERGASLRDRLRDDERSPTLVAIDRIPERAVVWVQAFLQVAPWLRILATHAGRHPSECKGTVIYLQAFSTNQVDRAHPSEAASFLRNRLLESNPNWEERRSDGAVMEEIAESLGGNAKLLCSAATIAAERGLPGLLEQTRRGALPSSQGEQRDFASRKARWGRLQGLAEAALSVLGFLPGTLNVLALRSVSERIALDFPGGQISDRVAAASADAQWDETLRELLRDQCVRVDSGRVAISNDLRQSVHEMAGPTAADVADALAVVMVRDYRDFDDHLEADLLAARAQFRADQPILRWIAQTVDDGRMAILTAGILARYALHATEANVEQPLALALQRAEGVPRDVVDEGTYALGVDRIVTAELSEFP